MRKLIFAGTLALGALLLLLNGCATTAKPANARTRPFILGAEVSWVPEDEADGAEYYDHGVRKDIFEILKEYKFNYIRLRLFVDPKSTNGYVRRRSEAFCDLEHVKALAKRAKAAGMGILLDIHYGDTWTSPGHQEKPVAWKDKTFPQLQAAVHGFTYRAIHELITNGTPANMVQIGNEVSDGMLFPDGGRSDFDNFAALVSAGIAGAKEADPAVKIVLHHHLGRSNERMREWIDNFLQRGVRFDVVGMSCYAQAQPGDWERNFNDLATRYTNLTLMVVEYSAQKRYLNDLMFNTPNQKGLGTFIWEPTRHREALFDHNGTNAGGGQASNFTMDEGVNQGARLSRTNAAGVNTNSFEFASRAFGTNETARVEWRKRRFGGRYDANDLFNLYPQMAKDYALPPVEKAKPEVVAATPPMGWNSYDAFGDSVTEDEVMANARYMQQHLLAHGWNHVVIDFRWYDPQPTGNDRLLNRTRLGAALTADDFGRLLPSTNRFPSAASRGGFKPLADQLHAIGLKFGIHVMRGIPRQAVLSTTPIRIEGSDFTAVDAGDTNSKCTWCPDMFGVRTNAAGQAWYDACVRLWASWGVDYIKVDDLSEPYHAGEIEMIRKAIDKCGRPIVFSTSPGPTRLDQAAHISSQANMWRISGDFWDNWPKLRSQFNLLTNWAGIGGIGHWPDADMIPFGRIAIRSRMGGTNHMTHFTRDEQYTLMSLWCLAPSPLMLGGNLPDNDKMDLSLLTNDEVLGMNQDKSGGKAKLISKEGKAYVFAKDLTDGAKAVGLFNTGDASTNVVADWKALSVAGPQMVRDMWKKKNLGKFENQFSAEIPPHGVVLLKISQGQ